MSSTDEWLTQQELADELGLASEHVIRRARQAGELRYTKLADNVVRIKRSWADEWLASLTIEPKGA